MEYFIVAGAALCFLFHLICETISSFVKYNFAGLGRHMQGVSIANIFAIASRGFVAIYGLLVAYIIERSISTGWVYSVMLSVALLIGAGVSFWFSRITLAGCDSLRTIRSWWEVVSSPGALNARKNLDRGVHINGFLSLLLGVQFVAIVIAYGLCFRFPEHRLLIISLVPVISMIGTLATVVFVEPRLANIIDSSSNAGYAVSQEFMRARSISFAFSFIVLLLLTVAFEI